MKERLRSSTGLRVGPEGRWSGYPSQVSSPRKARFFSASDLDEMIEAPGVQPGLGTPDPKRFPQVQLVDPRTSPCPIGLEDRRHESGDTGSASFFSQVEDMAQRSREANDCVPFVWLEDKYSCHPRLETDPLEREKLTQGSCLFWAFGSGAAPDRGGRGEESASCWREKGGGGREGGEVGGRGA